MVSDLAELKHARRTPYHDPRHIIILKRPQSHTSPPPPPDTAENAGRRSPQLSQPAHA